VPQFRENIAVKFYRTPMVTLDVKLSCEICRIWIIHPIRVGPNFMLGADNVPDGWTVRPEEFHMRAYCPQHSRDAK